MSTNGNGTNGNGGNGNGGNGNGGDDGRRSGPGDGGGAGIGSDRGNGDRSHLRAVGDDSPRPSAGERARETWARGSRGARGRAGMVAARASAARANFGDRVILVILWVGRVFMPVRLPFRWLARRTVARRRYAMDVRSGEVCKAGPLRPCGFVLWVPAASTVLSIVAVLSAKDPHFMAGLIGALFVLGAVRRHHLGRWQLLAAAGLLGFLLYSASDVSGGEVRLVVVLAVFGHWVWRYVEWACDQSYLSTHYFWHYSGVIKLDQDVSPLDRIVSGPEVEDNYTAEGDYSWGTIAYAAADHRGWRKYGPYWAPFTLVDQIHSAIRESKSSGAG